jgi:hypothetical protein
MLFCIFSQSNMLVEPLFYIEYILSGALFFMLYFVNIKMPLDFPSNNQVGWLWITSLLGFIWVQNRWIGDIKFIQHHIMLIYANSMILIGKYGTIFGTELFFFFFLLMNGKLWSKARMVRIEIELQAQWHVVGWNPKWLRIVRNQN